MKDIYFDNNSTTKPYDEVIKIISEKMEENYGNPSTSYKLGKKCKKILDTSRKNICKLLDIDNEESLIFTSGASESNNIVIRGCLNPCSLKIKKPTILCSSIEHATVYNTCIDLSNNNLCVFDEIKVDKEGYIIEQDLINKMNDNVILVCIMIANNEIGSIQNIKRLVNIVKKINHNTLFLCDCTQYIGKYKLSVKDLKIDAISFSSHKFHGPKGIGGLYIKNINLITPCITGGSQEFNIRAGTENISSIYAMMYALEKSIQNNKKYMNKVKKNRDWLENKLLNIPLTFVNCQSKNIDKRLYNTINITIPSLKFKGKNLLQELSNKNIYVNQGSACSVLKKSRVLKNIGLSDNDILKTLRISLCYYNTRKECEIFYEEIIKLCN